MSTEHGYYEQIEQLTEAQMARMRDFFPDEIWSRLITATDWNVTTSTEDPGCKILYIQVKDPDILDFEPPEQLYLALLVQRVFLKSFLADSLPHRKWTNLEACLRRLSAVQGGALRDEMDAGRSLFSLGIFLQTEENRLLLNASICRHDGDDLVVSRVNHDIFLEWEKDQLH